MNSIHRLALAALAPLALTACGSEGSTEDQPAEVFDGSAPIDTGPPAEEAMPEAAPFDGSAPVEGGAETVVEVDPAVGGTEPMDSAMPMADAGPMTDDFGMEESPTE